MVLDTTELWRDLTCVGLRFQLIEHLGVNAWLHVVIPAVVFEECVAHYSRTLNVAHQSHGKVLPQSERRRLGLHILPPLSPRAYREYLADRFDCRLGFTLLPWPEVSHADVVARAVNRIQPFNRKGSGYRDTLVWMDVCRLAREGKDVVLISNDKDAFAGPDGSLSPALAEEVANAKGSVELVPEFEPWLLRVLPRASAGIAEAVKDAQDSELFEFCMPSDFLGEIAPTVVDLGFQRSPWFVTIDEVDWAGEFLRVETHLGSDGRYAATYDLDFNVAIAAHFPPLNVVNDEWALERIDSYGLVTLIGSMRMVARLIVVFGADVSFMIDDIEWRRADGVCTGADVYNPNDGSSYLSVGS
ncbi:PIN domain-containing protein [Tessaracoccus lubricantis]|uniref:PIN domain-containing protein n=1 Tax=Tessaracoccus lubricantis TaxID=545543 RepID=UPI0031EF29C8